MAQLPVTIVREEDKFASIRPLTQLDRPNGTLLKSGLGGRVVVWLRQVCIQNHGRFGR